MEGASSSRAILPALEMSEIAVEGCESHDGLVTPARRARQTRVAAEMGSRFNMGAILA